METLGSVLLPIRTVPMNVLAETFEWALGSMTGSAKLASAYARDIKTLPPEQADVIMRQLKKGSIGAALLAYGYFRWQSFGGFYEQGVKRDKKDVKPGSVRIGGEDIPAHRLHNNAVQTMQIGAMVGRVAHSKLHKKDLEERGIDKGVEAALLGLVNETPFAREMVDYGKLNNAYTRHQFVNEYAKGILVPRGVQEIAEHYDKNPAGEVIKRAPETLGETIETGIPGLRQRVRSDAQKRQDEIDAKARERLERGRKK